MSNIKNPPLVATVAGLHVIAYRDLPRYSMRIMVAPTNTENVTHASERAMHSLALAIAARILDADDGLEHLTVTGVQKPDDRKVGARWYTCAAEVTIGLDYHSGTPPEIHDLDLECAHASAVRVAMARM